jgi:hypothetical protein
MLHGDCDFRPRSTSTPLEADQDGQSIKNFEAGTISLWLRDSMVEALEPQGEGTEVAKTLDGEIAS